MLWKVVKKNECKWGPRNRKKATKFCKFWYQIVNEQNSSLSIFQTAWYERVFLANDNLSPAADKDVWPDIHSFRSSHYQRRWRDRLIYSDGDAYVFFFCPAVLAFQFAEIDTKYMSDTWLRYSYWWCLGYLLYIGMDGFRFPMKILLNAWREALSV